MRPNDSIDDLDTRIERAEQRLMARQDRLRSQWTQLGDEVRETLRPQRLVAPAAAGAGALVTGWWWLMRRRKAARAALGWRGAPPKSQAWHAAAAGAAGLPWVQILGFVGPLLGMARKLSASRRQRAPKGALPALPAQAASAREPTRASVSEPVRVATVATAPIDRARWAGRWIEQAATPVREASRAPAAVDVHYLLRADGGYDVVRRSVDFRGRLRVVRGVAQPVAGAGGGRMRIRFWPAWLSALPLSWDEHWVLHVDDDYTTALVAPRGGGSLSLLTRAPHLPPERVAALLQIARDRGLAADRLRFAGLGRSSG